MAACGGKSAPDARGVDPAVPERAETVADAYLQILPAGADALLEIDLGRLRDNATIGPLVKRLVETSELSLAFDVLRDADSIVVASYDLGEPEAGQITIVRGDRADQIADARKLDERTVVLANERLANKLDAVKRGDAQPLRTDSDLLGVRALAMPEKAKGASVRAVAVLDFDARVSLAGQLDIDPMPKTLSVWGDVADDLAIVALLSGDDADEAKRLGVAVERLRDRVARSKPLAKLVIGYVLRSLEIKIQSKAVRVILLVGPSRLERIVTRLMGKLS